MAENLLSCRLGHKKKTLSKWVQGATATGTLSDAQGFRRQMDGKLAERPDSAFHPPKASQTGCDHNFGKAVKVKVYHRFNTWPKICFLVASATRKNTLEMGPRSYGNRHTFRRTGFQEADGWQVNFTVTKPD